MVGARATNEKDELVLFLFLSEENIARLKDKKPMVLRNGSHPFVPEGMVIAIAVEEPEIVRALLKEPDMTVHDWDESPAYGQGISPIKPVT